MGRRQGTASEDLTRLTEAVAKWRAAGGGVRGSKIPDDLWNEAVRVARVDGVWRTAKALGFKYEGLKRRIERGDGGDRTQASADPVQAGEGPGMMVNVAERGAGRLRRSGKKARAEVGSTNGVAGGKLNGHSGFIALEMGSPADGRTVIELHGRHGDRMRMEVSGGVDVYGLAEKFWSRRP